MPRLGSVRAPGPLGPQHESSSSTQLHSLKWIYRRGFCPMKDWRNPTLHHKDQIPQHHPPSGVVAVIIQGTLRRAKEPGWWKEKDLLVVSLYPRHDSVAHRPLFPVKEKEMPRGSFCLTVCVCVFMFVLSTSWPFSGMSFSASCEAVSKNNLPGIPSESRIVIVFLCLNLISLLLRLGFLPLVWISLAEF